MKTQVSKESLLNYFAGRATALQKQAIDEWAKDEDNRELFFECLAMWESENPQFIADDRKALERHRQRMLGGVAREVETESTPIEEPVTHQLGSTWYRWLVAASVSLLMLVGGYVFRDSIRYTTFETGFGQTRSLTLSDGSQITLNANSSLRVPRFGFGQKTREVVLAGEADFSIKHMPNHQHFVVRTDKHFDVVVLGTEFMVNTREQTKKVVLNKGKVQLLYQEGQTNKQLTMKPGNLVTFDNTGKVSVKLTEKPENYSSWKEHRYVFDGTTLAEIGTLFKENYGIVLQIPDKTLAQETISGAFKAYSADELLETLTSIASLNYRQQGDTIIITQNH
ncbi:MULTISPECIES: FecR family protein [unclassified Spirosoma]|uniref:FecR family protein n=1 Tax=unclassified Spirosoma TaxID=2621999 RepID=UPI000961D175|nr:MULTISPECIES: FecR domain-containing protein [unclassified Spirosoma]MBN8824926.1 FecR domain-containing protein [Spirosoma sp.]OJW74754.1 MAG: iron dicitrate transport regulator FecR [Spirosoma sp. 48-14]